MGMRSFDRIPFSTRPSFHITSAVVFVDTTSTATLDKHTRIRLIYDSVWLSLICCWSGENSFHRRFRGSKVNVDNLQNSVFITQRSSSLLWFQSLQNENLCLTFLLLVCLFFLSFIITPISACWDLSLSSLVLSSSSHPFALPANIYFYSSTLCIK